jgi:hypothetical protein
MFELRVHSALEGFYLRLAGMRISRWQICLRRRGLRSGAVFLRRYGQPLVTQARLVRPGAFLGAHRCSGALGNDVGCNPSRGILVGLPSVGGVLGACILAATTWGRCVGFLFSRARRTRLVKNPTGPLRAFVSPCFCVGPCANFVLANFPVLRANGHLNATFAARVPDSKDTGMRHCVRHAPVFDPHPQHATDATKALRAAMKARAKPRRV